MSTEEQTPLLTGRPKSKTNTQQDKYGHYSLVTGLVLFVGLILSVLVRIPFNVFTYHPIFMTLFIVLSTEGIAILQPTKTAEEKRRGLIYHAIVQSLSYLSVLTGFSFIFYNKVISGKDHFTSFHGKMGLFVFIFLFIQLLFGITIGLVPRVYGSVDRAKSLWKYHRRVGYFLIILVWLTAQFGVRADYMYNNLYSAHLLWLHWLVIALVGYGLVTRIRISKWGIK
ncbi:hypothetical protein K501DRAFT_258179 [Backusella circina FSU 941]|nr:hypothetical protein K501DRAFT_258179 [Backusella circina FSU 941]